MGLQARESLRFQFTAHEANTIEFKHRFEEVRATNIKHVVNFIVARVVKEAFVVKIGFVNFDWAALVTKHVLLKGHEA